MKKDVELIAIKYFPLFAFCGGLFFFWPGLMRPDSFVQMQQGLAGLISSDFHPPIMGIVWRLFSGIYKGPGVLFVLHFALYWGAIALFANARFHRAPWFYFISILPPVFAYQLLIIKDISFVNAYLFCVAWIHFYSARCIIPTPFSVIGWFLVVFYGTCAAYQSIIALPWLCLLFAKFYWPQKTAKWMVRGIAITVIIAIGVAILNFSLTVPSHRSQHHKLYDLAGISINLKVPIFPEYIKKYERYNFEKIKSLYNLNRGDDLTFPSDSPIVISSSTEGLKELNKFWLSAIFSYPAAYLKHRYGIFYRQLTVSLLKHPKDIKGEITPKIAKILNFVENFGIFSFCSYLMSYIAYFFIQLALIFLSYKRFNEDEKYVILFFQNIMGVVLVLSLFFISSAAEARYAYLAIAMFYFSLPFMFEEKKEKLFIAIQKFFK